MASFIVDKAFWESMVTFCNQKAREKDHTAELIVNRIADGGYVRFDDGENYPVDEMVELIRYMDSSSCGPESINQIFDRAGNIFDKLPKPIISQDVLDARDHLKSLPGYQNNVAIHSEIDLGEYDDNPHVISFIAGLNTGRNNG